MVARRRKPEPQTEVPAEAPSEAPELPANESEDVDPILPYAIP